MAGTAMGEGGIKDGERPEELVDSSGRAGVP